MSLISDWQSYVPPKYRVSQSAAHLVNVKPSFYMSAPLGGSQNMKAPGNVFYEETWPLFFILKVAGLFPYRVSFSGKLLFKLVSTVTLYSAVLVVLITVGTLLTLAEKCRTLSLTDITFERKIIYTVFSSSFVLLVVAPLMHCTEIWKRIKFINSWGTFQEEFCRVTEKSMDLGLRRRVRCVAVFCLIGTMGCTIGLHRIEKSLKWWQYCTHAFGSLLMALPPVLWYLICQSLTTAAKNLGDEIEQGFLQHGFRHTNKLVQFKFLWLSLCRLTQDLGSSMGLTYAVLSLHYFGVLVTASYGFFVSIRNDFSEVTFSLACAMMITLATLFIQCTVAQSASEEVGLSFQERVQSLLQKYPSVSSATHIEIDRFLAVINANPPVINFCGFVEVNRNLITSLLSQLLTYLIVLTQINVSPQPDESDKKENNFH